MGLFGKSKFQKAFPDYRMLSLSGDQANEAKPVGFCDGGEKFRARDGIAAALAAIGDGFAHAGGGQATAVQNLTGGRQDALDAVKLGQAAAAKRQQDIQDYEAKKQIDQRYQPAPEAPSDARLADWYKNATPEQRSAFDQIRPIITNGYGSAVVPRSSMPGAAPAAPSGLTPMTPEEIQRLGLPHGGPSQPATGGFRHFRR